MAAFSRVSVILPAYNEEQTIEQTLREVTNYFRELGISFEIIVAVDGGDGTSRLATAFGEKTGGIRVISANARRGKGRGVREAVLLTTGEIVGFIDADNKVPISEFGKVVPWFDKGYQVVIGSRAMEQSVIEKKQPWYRQVGSRGFTAFRKCVVRLPGIADTQCGFKFFTREAALALFHRQTIDGYMFDIEILHLAQLLGYAIKEIPIRWHDDHDSRLQLLRGNLRNVLDVIRIRLSHTSILERFAAKKAKAGISA